MGSKKVTIGYQYYMGQHLVVCQDAAGHAEVLGVTMGGRQVWSGSVGSNARVYWNKPDLFGGKEKEGGVQGHVDYLFGGLTQGQNSYLRSRLGSTVPAFRGVLSLVLNQCYLTSISPYIKALMVDVRRCWKGWYAEKAVINTNYSNPIHILYEVITNAKWGMGYNVAVIDDANFRTAADTLHSEGFGLALVWRNESPLEDFINDILEHINAVLFVDPLTGRFRIRLIREDYDVESLREYGEHNIIKVMEFERTSIGETVNAVSVVYGEMGTDAERTVTAHNIANIAAQGQTVTQTRKYLGIGNAALAKQVCMRDLHALSAPLAKMRIVTDRSSWDLGAGEPVKVSWPDLGIASMVLRVTGYEVADERTGTFTIDLIEDVFGMPAASYMGDQTPDWVDPVGDPQVVPHLGVVELPYGELQQTLLPEDFAEVTDVTSIVGVLAARSSGLDLRCDLYAGPASGQETNEFDNRIDHAPWGQLADFVTRTDTDLLLATQFSIDLDLELPVTGVIGNELVRITNVAVSESGVTITCLRGVYDSNPAEHTAGTNIFVLVDTDCYDPEERADGETVWYRPVNVNGQGAASWAASSNIQINCVARQFKPACPGNVKINGEYFPASVFDDLSFSWTHRDRTSLNQPMSWFDSRSEQETDTMLTLTLRRDSAAGAIVKQEVGLTGTSYTYDMATEQLEHGSYATRFHLTLTVERNGEPAMFHVEHLFDREFTFTGDGFDLSTEDDSTPTFDLLTEA